MSILDCVVSPAPRYLLRLHILQALFKRYVTVPGRFLEIGPGNGDVACYFSTLPQCQGGQVIDRSEKAVAIVRERLRHQPAIEVACADVLELDDGSFDYVLSFEVLEHIEDDSGFMRHVHGKLRPGGLWFISVPAYMRQWQQQDVYSGHVRRYEQQELRDKLTAAGFTVQYLRDYGFPLTLLMRPFRDRYYKTADSRTALQQTLDSGTEGRAFAGMHPRLMACLLLPFRLLQWGFAWARLGDGLIVVARRHD